MVFVRLFLFVISTIGFFELIRKACADKVDIYFLPSLTIAIQVVFLFVGGLLNLLSEVTFILYFVGFVGFAFGLYKKKTSILKSYINVGYVFLFISLIILAIYLKGKIFTHYDNFSHWAIVVKIMLEINRYPNFEDTLIMFQEYPLGSATYIYFFSRLTSTSESIQMLAQSYMMMTTILPLFSFAKKNRVPVAILIASFANYVLLFNISITDLLVDTLLPLVGICGLLFTYLHCKTGEKKSLYFSMFYMVWIVQIKNSGIFFCVIIAILLFVLAWKEKAYLHGIICATLPFISIILWQKHCKYVFASAATSKHAMTVENYKSVFGDKTQEEIMSICSSLFKFMISYKEVWIAVGIVGVIGLLITLFERKFVKIFVKVTLFSLAIYALYQFGMLAMYLFSMPGGEATSLASIDRYTKTILIAILYVNMILAVILISNTVGKRMTGIITVVVFASFFVGMYISTGSIKTVVQNEIDTSRRDRFEELCIKYDVPKYDSYCFLIHSGDSEYAYYLGKYIFQSNDISIVSVENEETLDRITSRYLFVCDQNNEIINEWVEENYPEQLGNEVIVQSME